MLLDYCAVLVMQQTLVESLLERIQQDKGCCKIEVKLMSAWLFLVNFGVFQL